MNIAEIDRLVRAGWTLRLVAASELYAHRFSAYLDGPPESDIGHCAVGSTAELALLQLEHYVSQQGPAKETRAGHETSSSPPPMDTPVDGMDGMTIGQFMRAAADVFAGTTKVSRSLLDEQDDRDLDAWHSDR